jgi:lipopolysaccharide export system protein LptA
LKRFFTIACVALIVGATIFAQPGGKLSGSGQVTKKVVDLKADVMYPIPYGDTSAVCLVGNVAFYHAGAVITCDSAVRYSEKHMECYGNVLINKNDTYVYGDRADYNGETHEANVYSDLVKVIDGDAVLYTYKFSFNTKTNIGQFSNGGVVTSKENRLESDRGYYYADNRTVICVDRVEIHSDEYDLKGDSVVYNLSTDHAYYYQNTNIWNTQGDYLYADCGEYDKTKDCYMATRNGYVLTEKQEMWSDSIDYYKAVEEVVLRANVQIDDTEHKVLAFGDFGHYWKENEHALLTRRPSVISYDISQGDSLYMAADSMFLYTIDSANQRADSLQRVVAQDSLKQEDATPQPTSHTTIVPEIPIESNNDDNPLIAESPDASAVENIRPETDSLQQDSLGRDSVMTKAQRKELLRQEAMRAKAEAKAQRAAERKVLLDSIAARRIAKTRAKIDAERQRDSLRNARMAMRRMAKKTHLQKDSVQADSIKQQQELSNEILMPTDDLLVGDSLPPTVDNESQDSLLQDSVWRLIKAYRNVRIYRSDFQSVCDSLTAVSRDSTIHLYINPVLWHENNQVTSDWMDIFTANQKIVRAEFVGRPIMITELDTMHYNQVAGKTMIAQFENNEIRRNDVRGNAQTIYFMQEDGAPDIIGLLTVESGDMTFYIEEKRVVGITYRNNPVYTIYPMDKIPANVELFLRDFRWEASLRPTQKDVFDRTIRTSLREVRSKLQRPQFPISARIDALRKQLITSRRWSDRDDVVQPDVVEWMYSIGYQPQSKK